MEKELTLVVLAAGMGSRFGGLKQIEPVGPNGEFIIDYSIYDAILAGFTKVVFIIKKENYDIFKETVGKRVEDKIKVEYAFQSNEDVPSSVNIPEDRVKPLGTAHAIYAARDVVKSDFAIINADDFYGRDAYIDAANFLKNNPNHDYGNISYLVGNTLSENGAVKRGIIFEKDGYLEKMVESEVEKNGEMVHAKSLVTKEEFDVPLDQPVSMNLFCFTTDIFTYLNNHIEEFFNNCDDIMTSEWLIPNVALDSAKENNKSIRIIRTNSKQYGMTYREDLDTIKKGILSEINNGVYKNNLWS